LLIFIFLPTKIMSKFQLLTKNGYDAFEVLSSFQKAQRMGLVKECIYRAFEMVWWDKSKDYSVWLRKRLCVCSVEDNLCNEIIPQINSLRDMYFFVKKSWSDSSEWLLFICRAAEILCGSSQKWRETTFRCLLNDTMPRLEIPEYALDFHTRRGLQRRKQEGKVRTRKDRVIEQQKSLNPQPKQTELYNEMLDKINDIMAKKKQKPSEESWGEDWWLFS